MVPKIVCVVALPSWKARGSVDMALFSSTISATSLLICVPSFITMARLAAFSAGTSLTPSPTMETYSPFARSASTIRCLVWGSMRAKTLDSATALANSLSAIASSSLPT